MSEKPKPGKMRVDSMRTLQRWAYVGKFPCLDDELMDHNKPPPFKSTNLYIPRLRKCPFDLDTIDWTRAKKLGEGVDGCVYRVSFGDDGPYVLKLFWVYSLTSNYRTYSAPQRECQNAALLQMLRASLDQAAAAAATVASGGTPDGPIAPPVVVPQPKDFIDASDNLLAFSDEIRTEHHVNAPNYPPDVEPVTSMPRFAKCYGWLNFGSKKLKDKMPRHVRPYGIWLGRDTYRSLREDRSDYVAIVYEYIHSEDGESSEEERAAERRWKRGRPMWPAPRPAPVPLPFQGPTPISAVAEDIRRTGASQRLTRMRTRQAARLEEAARMQEAAQKQEAARRQERARMQEQKKAEQRKRHREKVADVAEFVQRAGFRFCSQPLARNWKSGVLVDHSDIISPFSMGWQGTRPTPLDRILSE